MVLSEKACSQSSGEKCRMGNIWRGKGCPDKNRGCMVRAAVMQLFAQYLQSLEILWIISTLPKHIQNIRNSSNCLPKQRILNINSILLSATLHIFWSLGDVDISPRHQPIRGRYEVSRPMRAQESVWSQDAEDIHQDDGRGGVWLLLSGDWCR